MLSARSEDALSGYAMKLASWLSDRQNLNGDSPLLPDLTYTLGDRRNHHPHRLTFVASSIPDLIQELDAFAVKQDSVRIRTSFTPRPEHAPRIAFVMSGQGPQWWGMGRQLMQNEPVFRETWNGVMRHCRVSQVSRFWKSSAVPRKPRNCTERKLPSQLYSRCRLVWLRCGSRGVFSRLPLWAIASSEIAAACVAGLLTLEQGARVTALRARFMENCARGEGNDARGRAQRSGSAGVDR